MATVTVNSSAGLLSALKTAQSGDTILLASGTYTSVAITNFHPSGTVTITSASASNPAVISALTVTNSSGLKFSDINFATSLYSAPTSLNGSAPTPFRVLDSNNITFTGVSVHGTYSNADEDVNGMIVQNSSNVTITNSSFYQLFNAIGEYNNSNVNISNNTIHDIRVDGIDNAGTSNIVISGNQFSNFFPVGDPRTTGDHPDAIQFWTAGTTADASNIVISNNSYVRGTGDAAQGIFLTDQVGLSYNNVTVTGNSIIGSLGNGIDVSSATNVNVSNNSVVGYSDILSNIRLQGDINITMNNNISSGYYTPGESFISNLSNQTSGIIAPVLFSGKLLPITAVAEVAALNEYGSKIGNALAGDTGSGLYLADIGVGAASQKMLPSTGTVLTGAYGTLTVQKNGSYTYVETKSGLTAGQIYDDHFTLTVANPSGAVQTSTLDVLVSGSAVGNGHVDTIIGGAGAETISGFGARSTLISGTGPDTFDFHSLDQSTPSAQTKIQGFKNGDIIDLMGVDPNFHIVTRLDHHANELVITGQGNGSWEIWGDTTGSGVANFQIHLTGASVTSLTAANLHL